MQASITDIESNFGIGRGDAMAMLEETCALIQDVMVMCGADVTSDAVKELCKPSLDPRIKSLVAKIVVRQASAWRTKIANQRISWPRLLDMEWRVDMKTASQAVSRMSVPTVVLGLTVEEQPDKATVMPKSNTINFELSREELQTMLAGMKKIAEQLGKISGNEQDK